MCETEVNRKAQLKQTMYVARLRPPLTHNRLRNSEVTSWVAPSHRVQRNKASNNNPAQKNLDAPVQIGGQAVTMTLVPVLLPPHRKTANARLRAIPEFEVLARTC